ncbi:hypothetical protein VNO78_18742 [Psophocarpus tetragonolobus]|uniref:C2H2-type domain-containing protein n=1 Tax=Psophocarpus tetragonolobus TaxID=3891 RepID=A0AAN9S7H2_PSOTE
MTLNSVKSNNYSITISPRSVSNSIVPNKALAMKGMSQLGLNQGATKMKRTSLTTKANEIMRGRSLCLSPTLFHNGHDTKRIIRVSQVVRAQLVHAVSSPVSNVVVDTDIETEEKKKARETVQAKLLCASAFAPKSEVDTWKKPTSLTHHYLDLTSPLKMPPRFLNDFSYSLLNSSSQSLSQPNNDVGNGVTLSPSPLTICFANKNSNNNALQSISNIGGPINEIENVSGRDDKYDGRIHSYPYKKNGPYTCPKCSCMFETSQRFAAHVSSSHYKYESKSEKKKRLMAKIRRRNLRIEWVGDGLTVVPDDVPTTSISSAFGYAGNNSKVAPPPVTVKVEGQDGVQLQLAPPPGWEKLTVVGGVKIKPEPLDT